MIHQPRLPESQIFVLQTQLHESAGCIFHLEYFSSFFSLIPFHSPSLLQKPDYSGKTMK